MIHGWGGQADRPHPRPTACRFGDAITNGSQTGTLMLPPIWSISPAGGRMLGSYFRSGWAFLVPYVAAYLVYAWLKWPVHSASSAGETGQLGRECQTTLVHLYWALHFLHWVGGTIALHSWWSEKRQSGSQATAELLRPLVPWVLLTLVFWRRTYSLESSTRLRDRRAANCSTANEPTVAGASHDP